MRAGLQVLAGVMIATSVLGSAACHRTPDVATPGSGFNVITRDELESAGAVSVYDVIVRNHALFFRNRGPTSINSSSSPQASVFMDAQYYGEIETLRNVPASRIESVHFYPGTESAAKFGHQYNGGVIQLIPRYN